MITQDYLKSILSYNRKTGLFLWLVGRSGTNGCGSVAGTLMKKGYIHITINGRLYFAHRLAWLYVYGYFPENGVDHINRIRHDNRIANLREVSQQCNVRNACVNSRNTSGVKGVSWDKRTGKWYSQIAVDGKDINLGRYDDFVDSVAARLIAEQCLNWSGCDSDSPAYRFMINYLNEQLMVEAA